MVKTSSTMLPLGHLLPVFNLPFIQIKETEKYNSLNTFDHLDSEMLDERPVLMMVLCAHCPFVKHLEEQITNLDKDYGESIQILAVGSNSLETHPEDGPEYLFQQMIRNQWSFPYLVDSEQILAKALMAACTPDFFLFSLGEKGTKKLVYRGQFDDSRPSNNILPSGSDLRAALDAVLNFQQVSDHQKPSIGCNIKWIPGSEPLWFD